MSIKNSIKSLYYWFWPVRNKLNYIQIYYRDAVIGFGDKIQLTHNYHTVIERAYFYNNIKNELFVNDMQSNQKFPITLKYMSNLQDLTTYNNVWINGAGDSYNSGNYYLIENLGFTSDKPFRYYSFNK